MLAKECRRILNSTPTYVPAPEELPHTMPPQFIYSQPQYPTAEAYPPQATGYYVYPPHGTVVYATPTAPQPSYTIV